MCVCRVACTVQNGTEHIDCIITTRRVRWMDEADVLGEGHRPGCRVTVPAAGSRTPPDSSRATLCAFAYACVYTYVFTKRDKYNQPESNYLRLVVMCSSMLGYVTSKNMNNHKTLIRTWDITHVTKFIL